MCKGPEATGGTFQLDWNRESEGGAVSRASRIPLRSLGFTPGVRGSLGKDAAGGGVGNQICCPQGEKRPAGVGEGQEMGTPERRETAGVVTQVRGSRNLARRLQMGEENGLES